MELITASTKDKYFPESAFIEAWVPKPDSIAGFDVQNVRKKGPSDADFSTKNPGHLTKVFDCQELGNLLNYVTKLHSS